MKMLNYTEDGKRILNLIWWHKKADNVEGQWWGWLARWKTLAATLLIKWKKYAKGWEEDDRGNYLYCVHAQKNLDFINRVGA